MTNLERYPDHASLPVGTVVRWNSGTTFAKVATGRWYHRGESWLDRQLFDGCLANGAYGITIVSRPDEPAKPEQPQTNRELLATLVPGTKVRRRSWIAGLWNVLRDDGEWYDQHGVWETSLVTGFLDEPVDGTASDFRLDALLEILNTRCDHPVKPLIVTSNLDPVEIEKAYDDRVASRILAGTVYHVAGDDRRIRRAA